MNDTRKTASIVALRKIIVIATDYLALDINDATRRSVEGSRRDAEELLSTLTA